MPAPVTEPPTGAVLNDAQEKRVIAVRLGEGIVIAMVSAVLSAVLTVGILTERITNMQDAIQRVEKRVDQIYRDFYAPRLSRETALNAGDCKMDMGQAALVTDLKGILMDAAGKFTAANDADFIRHLAITSADLTRLAPTFKAGSFTLQVDVGEYASVPADMAYLSRSLWGDKYRHARQWDPCYPGKLPGMGTGIGSAGTSVIFLSPPPTARQIELLGTDFTFLYAIRYAIGATTEETTVPETHRELLLLRATAHALQELANNGITKPVQLGSSGVGSMPKNGHPAALAEQLLKLTEQMAAA